ncbi:related to regulator of reproduction [Lecanosticta acicola]|uniref:Related to regulator of reproduction n=1 Tax=Lecanosticta acicola TaxID=111012 RepID=A0AAI9E9W0_9PEZI|nr:related to regulator of reproduction [Lecanosticta acicola]
MSHDAAHGRHSVSPPSSGRSSPVPRATRRVVEDGLYKADKSLKRYAANIERVLSTWEIAPEEWADYIAFLGRLLKAIQTHPKDAPILPHSDAISTRLAQCLNPALPSGVHQKSLELYHYIFTTFGNDYIASHLHELLPGLSSVLSFASLTVRPGLYSLFEDHIVALSPSDLRPALKSLILGLLPALEEENSEDFERAFGILQSFEESFAPTFKSDDLTQESDGYFWQCLFLAVVSSPSRRQGALNFLSRKLPKLGRDPAASSAGPDKIRLSREAQRIISPEPGLLVRCFICSLSDPQILIQRGFLDLLVTHLPLDSIVLQEKIGSDDLDRLVTAATQVLLRRDMSLNRRLWSWFLGPEPKDQPDASQPSSPTISRESSQESEPSAQLRYFSRNGQASLKRCILSMLQSPRMEPSWRARPFRICLSLMDRWEIGGLLIPEVFLPAMKSLHTYSLNAPSNDVADVVRSASLFFDGVEASLIWERLMGVLRDAFERGQPAGPALQLYQWIINSFNVKDEEMLNIHIPHAILYLLSSFDPANFASKSRQQILTLLSQMLEIVPARVFKSSGDHERNVRKHGPSETAGDDKIRRAIAKYYRGDEPSTGKPTAPYDSAEVLSLIIPRIVSILEKALSTLDSELCAQSTALFMDLLSKKEGGVSLHGARLRETLTKTLCATSGSTSATPFPIISSTIMLMTMLRSQTSSEDYFSESQASQLTVALSSRLWEYFSPEKPKYHVEATKALWQLEDFAFPGDALAATLTGLVRNRGEAIDQAEATRRFCVLWNHSITTGGSKSGTLRRGSAISVLSDAKQHSRSLQVLERPLLLIIDQLEDPELPAFDVVKSWLDGLHSLDQVLVLLFRNLSELRLSVFENRDPGEQQEKRRRDGDIRGVEYVLSLFQNILTHDSEWTWQCLSRILVTGSTAEEEHDGFASLTETCLALLCNERHRSKSLDRRLISILELLLNSPAAVELKPLDLDTILLDRLVACIEGDLVSLQGGILRLVQAALKLRLPKSEAEQQPTTTHRGSSSNSPKRNSTAPYPRPTTSASVTSPSPTPPPQLFKCLRLGFSSPATRYHLDQWLAFLADVLPNFADAIFSNLLPLIECFCQQLRKNHEEMLMLSKKGGSAKAVAPEAVAMSLLDGLEMLLDRAYECLVSEAVSEPPPKENEAKQSFLTNVTSGVFKSEGPPSRTSTSNNRLTVILAFQDSIRVALRMWIWASKPSTASDLDDSSSATTAYNALRVRNKTRHLLEQIFSVEPLESLEVLIAHWCFAGEDTDAHSALSILQVMQVSRPKNVVPATLNALGTRTNPGSIPTSRTSSLTLDLSPSDIATFFSAYLDSTEDDAMDEIWQDCITFSKDVLANPLPYRQILPHLLSIILLLAEKLNNTNFGEQRKMRRELTDIFQRLLSATFTALPSGYIAELAAEDALQNGDTASRHARIAHSMTLIPVLNRVVGKIDLILDTQERIGASVNTITASLLVPTFHARSFPKNVNDDVLTLVTSMTRKAPSAKSWKKEISEAFNDPRLLSSAPAVMINGWFPVLHQWSLYDKERMPELLARLAPPSGAGIMFGVGASAARLEADRKTQFNLRRICILLLASPEDTYVAHLRPIEEKLAELFEASRSSSPSAAIRAELFMLCRSLALSVSTMHLSPLWPIINDRLQSALTSLLPNSQNANDFNNLSLLQACKLLDLLIALSPDEFQLHEWLYITDTVDAVYQPADWNSAALSDQVAEVLGSTTADDNLITATPNTSASAGRRRALLADDLPVDKDDIKALPKEEFVRAVLRPFLSQLSIHAYESVYSMDSLDADALKRDLLNDLLDLGSIVE